MINNFKRILPTQKKQLFPIIFWVLVIFLVIFLFFYRLNNWPYLWWDEGWTLDAARNWIVHGHLGQYLEGIPIPPRIPVRFPIVVPIALSMKIFGVGAWQGRLPGVIFTLLSLCFVFYLGSKIFNRKTGIAALLILLFLSPFYFNPIFIGRQVLAEMPMMFYLLGGYSLVWLALNKSAKWGVGAALLFGVAIHAKLQVPLFWVVSFVLAIWLTISYHRRQQAMILGEIALGSITFAAIILIVQNMFMTGSFSDPELIKILFNSVIFVVDWPVRNAALLNIVLSSIPQLLGYIWAGWLTINYIFIDKKDNTIAPIEFNRKILLTALWGLGASWFVWYLAMGMFWSRYLFPPYFVGCIFFAAYLGKLSEDFNLRLFVRRTSGLLLGRELKFINLQAIVLLLAFSINFGVMGKTTITSFLTPVPDPYLASAYLHNHIPSGTEVESFESELLFLTPEIKFHYPSDLVSMQLVRKWNIDPQLIIAYDPLATNPDYLVVGPYARDWHLYDDVLSQGKLQLEADIGGYQIYQNQSLPIPR